MQRRRRRWTWRDWRTACGPFWQKVPKKPPRYQHQAQAGSPPPAVPDWAGIDNCVFCQETAAVETAEVCGEKAFSETTQTLLKRYWQTLPKSMRNRRGFDFCCFCAAPDYQAAWLRTCRCLWPLSLCSISLMKRWVPLRPHGWSFPDLEVHVVACALSQTESGAGEGGRHVGHHHQTRPLRRHQENLCPSIYLMLFSDFISLF